MERDLKKLVASMTLEEKAGMCSGADFWNTKAVERLEIPGVMSSRNAEAGRGSRPPWIE
jgi:beta-glucosidase